ncbi:MAG: anthranilate synthase component I [Thermodesulfobacteriota bacterium]|nr:anthranilate synthase component I [Thermodesulfobacteriota bacterium]
MASPSLDDFKRLARLGNFIPVHEEVHFDWETPISAFRKIDSKKFSFLLESVEGGEKWGRYSFLGSGPSHLFRSQGEEYEILKNGEVLRKGKSKDPLRALEAFLGNYRPVLDDSLPRFFGGAVGYVSYDTVRSFEKIPEILPPVRDFHDCCFMITDTLLIFDNVRQTIKVIAGVFLDGSQSPEEAYRQAEERVGGIVARLRSPSVPAAEKKSFSPSPLRSNLSREEFIKKVERAKEYIRAGDVIQVVLSQRFSTELHCDPFDVYRALRSINPSPYLFYLQMDDTVLLGASPEVMVRLEGNQIELRPLAGTRRRGKTEEEDREMEKDLLADEKERAEHIMLVDLGRNDVGRVAEIGSVEVTELMGVERYSHVMHIVSNVRGLLAPGKTAFDVFRAAFPAGTVTGAPKIRAMEIIEELEPVRRGSYAGAVGYFSFSKNMDTCITIRSVLIREGKAYIQAGAGIVADSEPEREFEETLNKAQAIFKSIERAEEGLP